MDFLHKNDTGMWSVRFVTHGRVILPIIWCNFTLVVLEDLEEDEADPSRVVGLAENRYPHEKTAASNSNNRRSFLPKFIQFETMQKSRLVVKPPGATVTLKCWAKGL